MSEQSPLLESSSLQRYGEEPLGRLENEGSSPDTTVGEESIKPSPSFKAKQKQFLRKRFWWFCIFGLLAFIVLQLSFLPRTSLNRDFRRWHDLHLTQTDLKRIFLAQLKIGRPDDTGVTNEEHIGEWLRNFTSIHSQKGVVLADGKYPELASFVEQKFYRLGFSTLSHEYELPQLLRLPKLSKIELFDSESHRILYSADLAEVTDSWRFKHKTTPAFFPFSSVGSVTGDFVYVHGGTPKDYALLELNGIAVADKIALIASLESRDFSVTDRVDYALFQGCLAAVVIGSDDFKLTVLRNYKPADIPDVQMRVPASYKAISPILEALGPGTGNFSQWRFSPLSHLLRLKVTSEAGGYAQSAKVVIGSIKGVMNDGEIIIGASRDSLTSLNPSSGHAIMLEVMRAFKRLRNLGWKPLRTIRFVSWDASRSGQLGARAALQDAEVFPENMPLLAYINLDEDVVTGSHFSVDLSPLLNHIIKQVAEIVPVSKNSTSYKRVVKPSVEDTPSDEDDDDNETSLYHYWRKESGANINNVLGDVFTSKDAGVFQFKGDTPVINFKFSESSQHNESTYVPELDHYSYSWLQDIDPNLDLHGLLVRFLGLLVLSLEEREVVDYRLEPYLDLAQKRFDLFKEQMSKQLEEWKTEKIDTYLLEKSAILKDILDNRKSATVFSPGYWSNADEEVTLADVLTQFGKLIKDAGAQSLIFDAYNHDVENLLTEDYPWYKMLKKVHIYAKFKVTNYKLLRVEKDLAATDDDIEYGGDMVKRHFMYEAPVKNGVCYSDKEKEQRGAFAGFFRAVEEGDLEQLIKLIVIRYEHLHVIHKKIQ